MVENISKSRKRDTKHDQVESWCEKAEEQNFEGVNLSHDLGIEARHTALLVKVWNCSYEFKQANNFSRKY